MLKEFIKCATIEERLQLLKNSKTEDWTDAQIDTAFQILGLPVNSNMSLENKIKNLKSILKERASFLSDVTFTFDDTNNGISREEYLEKELDSNNMSKLASLYLINSGALAR